MLWEATMRPSPSNTTARELVVPWSSATIYFMPFFLPVMVALPAANAPCAAGG